MADQALWKELRTLVDSHIFDNGSWSETSFMSYEVVNFVYNQKLS